jgi:hypothetical protein
MLKKTSGHIDRSTKVVKAHGRRKWQSAVLKKGFILSSQKAAMTKGRS